MGSRITRCLAPWNITRMVIHTRQQAIRHFVYVCPKMPREEERWQDRLLCIFLCSCFSVCLETPRDPLRSTPRFPPFPQLANQPNHIRSQRSFVNNCTVELWKLIKSTSIVPTTYAHVKLDVRFSQYLSQIFFSLYCTLTITKIGCGAGVNVAFPVSLFLKDSHGTNRKYSNRT